MDAETQDKLNKLADILTDLNNGDYLDCWYCPVGMADFPRDDESKGNAERNRLGVTSAYQHYLDDYVNNKDVESDLTFTVATIGKW
jgi:hypothetical protein